MDTPDNSDVKEAGAKNEDTAEILALKSLRDEESKIEK